MPRKEKINPFQFTIPTLDALRKESLEVNHMDNN
jgi:hypothetical protein